ncbi:hypothetical protein KSF78_0000801 [Schistosoma japonicum]|nr:hypothetical protein KSF78_0000801 [Schistosoma japonicum]
MGGRSGKFIVPRVEEKTEDSPREADTFEQVKAPDNEQSVQPSDDAKLENGLKENFTDENCEQANGSVAATDVLQNDSAKPPKKGNPISRILRRISRKGSNLKKHSTDRSSEIPEDTNDESIQEQTTEAHPECTADRSLDSTDNPVLIAADNLVHDVILSATQTHLEETQVSRIEPCEEIHNHVETSHTQVNGVNFDNTNDHIDDGVIQSKLANLELVNGHSEVNGFHNETGNSVKLADDY